MNPRSPAAPDAVGRGAASLRPTMGLFWRTFLLLALLILGSTISLLQLFRLFEYEPSTLRNAYQIATVVNLTRSALVAYSVGLTGLILVKVLAPAATATV